MNVPLLVGLVSALSVSLGTHMLPAQAHSSETCPDYPAHQEVLNEAQRRLNAPFSIPEDFCRHHSRPGTILEFGFQSPDYFPAEMHYGAPQTWPRGFEKKPFKSQQTNPSDPVTLLSTYIERRQYPDAQQVLAKILTEPSASYFVPSEQLALLIPELSADLQHPLGKTIIEWIEKRLYKNDDVALVAEALVKKHWDNQAEKIYQAAVYTAPRDNLPRAFLLIDFYTRRKQPADAARAYHLLISNLAHPMHESFMSYMSASDDLRRIIDRISTSQYHNSPSYLAVVEYAKTAKSDVDKRLSKLECLRLAEELSDAGLQLETKGDYAGALKVYESALEIRRKNLAPNDRLLAEVFLNLARVTEQQNKVTLCDSYFENALAIFRNSPGDPELESTLQAYGSFLQRSKQEAKANKIYAEAQKVHADAIKIRSRN